MRFIETEEEELEPKKVLSLGVETIKEFRFSPDRLSSAGYGKFHPVAGTIEKQTNSDRMLNRRVDIVVKRIGSKIGKKKGVKAVLK